MADTAATVALLDQDAPRRLRDELDLFREEVEREAERLERGDGGDDVSPQATSPAAAGAPADPQDQIDALRARVAELSRRLEQPPGGGSAPSS